jgi:L-ascorbate metabolism protein UlaG (beta-lactamase superfamily)
MAVANASPDLAVVVASHGHYDHYDVDAFAAYRDRHVPFLVKRGTAAAARRRGFTGVIEMDPWETARVGTLTI